MKERGDMAALENALAERISAALKIEHQAGELARQMMELREDLCDFMRGDRE